MKQRLICNECGKYTYNVDLGHCIYCKSENYGIEDYDEYD